MKTALPFLHESKWPISKEPEERVANPSYDTQLSEHLVDEILIALEKKDASKLRESLVALVEHLRTEE